MADIAELGLKVDSKGVQQGAKDLKDLSGAAGKAERSIGQVSSASSALNKVLGLTAGYLSARAIIQASDQYGQMAARIKMATSSAEEYVKVQARLLDTANNTYRALGEAQELYIRTADAIRSLGYNTDEVLDITDSFSYLLVTNAASADRASSAINAYSKAIATGKVDADTWQSILAATPTIVDDIAAATGRSTDEVRKFGIQGKISLTALNEALLQSRDRNEELAASMETSVQDATTALSNSFQVFVGKVNETSGASSILTGNIGELAEILQDPETIRAAQEMAAGVVGALNTIIKTAKETVNVVKWAAESAAAFMSGIASDDIVRLNDEIARLQEMKKGGALDKLVFFGRDGIVSYYNEAELDAEIAKLQAAVARAMVGAPQIPGGTDDQVGSENKERAAVELVTAAVEKKTKARKGLTDAQKEAQRAAEELAKAEQSNADVIASLTEQIYQAGLSAEELAKRQAVLRLNEYATPEQIAAVQQLAGELQRLDDAGKSGDKQKQNQQILGQLDPMAGEEQRFAAELENLRLLNEAKLIEDQRYLDLKGQAEREHAEQVRILQEENFRAQSAGNELIMASLDQLQQAGTNALTGLITGASNGEEAIRALAGAILNEAVGAVVQMGIQYVKTAVMGQAAAAAGAATAISTGVATAAALSAAYSTPAALVSLATFGANAPAATAGIASTIATSKALSLTSFDGGGYTGNSSRTGGLDGKGGFLAMMHPQETVIDHTKGQSMGGTIINIIESKDRAGTQQQRQGADGREEVDVFVADIMGDGKRARALQAAFGLQRRGA